MVLHSSFFFSFLIRIGQIFQVLRIPVVLKEAICSFLHECSLLLLVSYVKLYLLTTLTNSSSFQNGKTKSG